MDELSAIQTKRYIRGKFELWFFVAFLTKALEILRASYALDGRNLPGVMELSEAHAIELLAPRLDEPNSLRKFFEANSL
jgi:hypothetical protein